MTHNEDTPTTQPVYVVTVTLTRDQAERIQLLTQWEREHVDIARVMQAALAGQVTA